jgi:predicted PurR-regulated permease PerM
MYPRFYRRAFVIGTVAVLGYVLLRILEPFWGPLAWASVLAFLFYPVHERLTRRLKGRAGASAGIITGLTPFFVLAPLSLLSIMFARQVAALIEHFRGRTFVAYPALLAKAETYPVIGPALSWLRENASVSAEQVQGWLTQGVQSVLRSAATMGSGVVLGVVGTLVGFFLTLFLLFFLLRDGRSMLEHVARLVPMEKRRRSALVRYLGDVTRAVAYGSTMTALIQGTLVGIGFAIAGLPSPVVFGVLGGLAAFIPAAGTGVVLIPAVIVLAIMGRWGAAIFLGLWSLLVGFSDNFLRPLLAAQRADVSALAVFIGVIGGVAAFGFIGLIIGPVLLSLIVALLRFAEESVTEKD